MLSIYANNDLAYKGRPGRGDDHKKRTTAALGTAAVVGTPSGLIVTNMSAGM